MAEYLSVGTLLAVIGASLGVSGYYISRWIASWLVRAVKRFVVNAVQQDVLDQGQLARLLGRRI